MKKPLLFITFKHCTCAEVFIYFVFNFDKLICFGVIKIFSFGERQNFSFHVSPNENIFTVIALIDIHYLYNMLS